MENFVKEKANSYRLSAYTIFIELKDASHDYMLIHGYTGALDLASKRLVDYLRLGSFDTNNEQFPPNIIEKLEERGYITQKSLKEERDEVKRRANLLHRQTKLHKSFTILMTYNCNFRCPYCYENAISKDGSNWSEKTMTKSMVDKLYRTIFQIEPQKEFINKKITLYGGEPLLAKNKEIIEYTVNKGRELGFSFKAITNGYDLDSFSDMLKPGYIDMLQITIDGSEYIHNKRRFHHSNGASFRIIMNNIQMALDLGVIIAIRVNLDSENIIDFNELKLSFEKYGFFRYKNFSVSPAKVSGNNIEEREDGPLLSRMTFLKEMYSPVNQQNATIHCQDNGITRSLLNALANKSSVSLSSTFCNAQSGGFVMDPLGNIYTCWECVGAREHIVGNYKNELIWNQENLDKWQRRNISVLPKCSICKYAFLCRGNCLGHILQNGGNYTSSRCEDFSTALKFIANKMYHLYTQLNINNLKN